MSAIAPETPTRVNPANITISSAHTPPFEFVYRVHLEGEQVGAVSLTRQDKYRDTLWIAGSADLPNQGVMSAAGAQIAAAVCDDPAIAAAGITKVYTYIHPDNHASLGVIVKFGFVELPEDPHRPGLRRWLAHLHR